MTRLILFLVLFVVAVVGYRMWGGPSQSGQSQPHGVVGQTLPPSMIVTPLHGGDPRPLSEEVIGVTVINYFGSWCAPCRAEVPALLRLRGEGVRVIGVAVRDEPTATQAFLDELGDPFFRVVNDPDGAGMASLGLGADVPQTLVVGRDGEVIFHHSGPLVGTDGEAAIEEIRDLAGPR